MHPRCSRDQGLLSCQKTAEKRGICEEISVIQRYDILANVALELVDLSYLNPHPNEFYIFLQRGFHGSNRRS